MRGWRCGTCSRRAAPTSRRVATLKGVAADDPQAFDAGIRTAASLVQLRRYDEAFASLKVLASVAPSAVVSNLMGIVQLRRGAASAQTGRATYFFHQAAELEPADADYCFNLGYAYWLDKDATAAAYWLREAVRRDPDRRGCALRARRRARPPAAPVRRPIASASWPGGSPNAGKRPPPAMRCRAGSSG